MDFSTSNISSLVFENYNYLIIGLVGLLVILLVIWVWRLEKKIKNLLGGKNNLSIESAIVASHEQIKELKKFRKKTEENLKSIDSRLRRSIQSVETIRFNPFKGVGAGGNQSFSSAFLNEEGDGLVISGLYLRDRVSVYAKPVKNYSGEYELSEEEKETIGKAKTKIQEN